MRVLAVSKNNKYFAELENKIGASCNLCLVAKDTILIELEKQSADILFFLDLKVPIKTLKMLANAFPDMLFVYNAVAISPAILASKGVGTKNVLGMNLLPTFINRSLAEINSNEPKPNATLLEKLGWQVQWVNNRVGMVTPRVIFMIINEAYFTVQEGTANKEDIDTGMKLGTNYPHGPFEWAAAIGLENIYNTLIAMLEDTQDGRYKVCPMLKNEVLLAKTSS